MLDRVKRIAIQISWHDLHSTHYDLCKRSHEIRYADGIVYVMVEGIKHGIPYHEAERELTLGRLPFDSYPIIGFMIVYDHQKLEDHYENQRMKELREVFDTAMRSELREEILWDFVKTSYQWSNRTMDLLQESINDWEK